MKNTNKATAQEIFDIWYKGQHTIAELARTYGWDISALSHAFDRLLDAKRQKNKEQKCLFAHF